MSDLQGKDIIELIDEKYVKMSKSHKKIADFIKEHYDQAVFMTAAKIGAVLDISESTVVRFASGLGFDGIVVWTRTADDCYEAFTKRFDSRRSRRESGKSDYKNIFETMIDNGVVKTILDRKWHK